MRASLLEKGRLILEQNRPHPALMDKWGGADADRAQELTEIAEGIEEARLRKLRTRASQAENCISGALSGPSKAGTFDEQEKQQKETNKSPFSTRATIRK